MALTRFLGSQLWLQWTVITLAGFLVGSITGGVGGFLGVPLIGYLLSIVIRGCEGQGAIGCILIGAALGAALGLGLAVGTAQWLILRRIVRRSQWWILASALGWCGIAFTLTTMLYGAIAAPGSPNFEKSILERLPSTLPAIAQVTTAGALMGLFQWLILRSTLRQSFWWIVANALIMLLAALGVFILGYNIGGLPGMGVFIISFSPIYAVLSGTLLDWLVQHNRNQTTI